MKLKLLLFTLGLTLICQGSVFAQDKKDGKSPVRVLKASLNLTEEQVTELRELITARAAAVREKSEQIKLTQKQIGEETQAELPDPQLIGELVLMVSMLKQDIGQHQQVFQTAFRAMLTEEQLNKLSQIYRIALMNQAAEALKHLKLR
jgi:fructose-bisphosphate aldolase class 1